jgi:hypothetical protein
LEVEVWDDEVHLDLCVLGVRGYEALVEIQDDVACFEEGGRSVSVVDTRPLIRILLLDCGLDVFARERNEDLGSGR